MLDCGTMLAFGQNARPVDLVGAPAIGSDLSLGDKVLQCRAQRRRFFDRIVAEVELEQIDPVRAESAQTVLAILPDVSQHGFAVPPGGPLFSSSTRTPNLVAITTSARLPARAPPRIRSLRPARLRAPGA